MSDDLDSDKDPDKSSDEAETEEQSAASEINENDLEQIGGGLSTPPEVDPWFKKRGNLTQDDLKWNNRTKIIKGEA